MYRQIISIKEDTPADVLWKLAAIAEQEFDNRAGRVRNVSKEPYQFVFEGEEESFGCLNLGMFELWDKKDFVSYVQDWQWIDEEPDESYDVIKELSIPVLVS